MADGLDRSVERLAPILHVRNFRLGPNDTRATKKLRPRRAAQLGVRRQKLGEMLGSILFLWDEQRRTLG